MYSYTEFDRQFLRQRAAQFRDQLQRWQSGSLSEAEFRPLRLQNGWYVQRHAPMLRVAVPYGDLSVRQLRALAHVARHFDQPDPALFHAAGQRQQQLGAVVLRRGGSVQSRLAHGVAHFTTRQNVQFNWIPLARAADVMDTLAEVDLHGIQTSGNCIRNVTSDALAGIAPDEVCDPRPFAELVRQWSTVHPEFCWLPRKFKVAISAAADERAATAWHDIGLRIVRGDDGEPAFDVYAGGGMGRTPLVASRLVQALPWPQLLNYLEAVLRVYNAWGRRDNAYKARLKVLMRADHSRFVTEVAQEFERIVTHDGAPNTITETELADLRARFVTPAAKSPSRVANAAATPEEPAYARWLQRNVHEHRDPRYRAVTLTVKRAGQAAGDVTATQLDAVADLCERFGHGWARVTHQQNLLLPWVAQEDLPDLWQQARVLGLAQAQHGLLTDLISCPGGDYCDLANARSLPLAEAVQQRYQDLDELWDLGPIDLHISGCINSCGHHHSGHIGILGVDKDGREWYQISVGGSDGSQASGVAQPGKVLGPSFSASEVPEALEAILDCYRLLRLSGETLIEAVRRVGHVPFRAAVDAVRVQSEHAEGSATLEVAA